MEINQTAPKFQDESIAPMHTTEHLLNQTMIRMFGCERSKNAHIERKKSKISYPLPQSPSEEQVKEIERKMNEVITQNLPVTYEFISREQLPPEIDLSKLPYEISETIRIVRIGNYDVCACIGTHVNNTSEIGSFKINSWRYENGIFRIVFKLI